MNWMQSSDRVQQNIALPLLNIQKLSSSVNLHEIALLFGITPISRLLTVSCERHGHRYR
jgi:hypothetical protein